MVRCDDCGTVYEDERRRCPYCGIGNPDCDLNDGTPDDEDVDGEEEYED